MNFSNTLSLTYLFQNIIKDCPQPAISLFGPCSLRSMPTRQPYKKLVEHL